MKISIILPTYKRLAYLAESLPSVIRQSYLDWECIVINDDPESCTEIDKYVESLQDSRIQVIHNPQNLHIAHSRNKGMAVASGEVLAFLDDDDIWLPQHLEYIANRFQENPATGMVYSGYISHWEGQPSREKTTPAVQPPANLFLAMLTGKFTFPLASIVSIRKACLLKTGDFDTQANSLEDWDLFLRIAQDYPVDYVPQATAIWRIHNGQRLSKNLTIRLEALNNLRKKWGTYPEFEQFTNRLLLDSYHSELEQSLMNQVGKKPFLLILESIQKCGIKNVYNAKTIAKMFLMAVFGRIAVERLA